MRRCCGGPPTGVDDARRTTCAAPANQRICSARDCSAREEICSARGEMCSAREEICSAREEMRSARREEMRPARREEMRSARRDEMCSAREEMRSARREEMRSARREEMRSARDEKRSAPRVAERRTTSSSSFRPLFYPHRGFYCSTPRAAERSSSLRHRSSYPHRGSSLRHRFFHRFFYPRRGSSLRHRSFHRSFHPLPPTGPTGRTCYRLAGPTCYDRPRGPTHPRRRGNRVEDGTRAGYSPGGQNSYGPHVEEERWRTTFEPPNDHDVEDHLRGPLQRSRDCRRSRGSGENDGSPGTFGTSGRGPGASGDETSHGRGNPSANRPAWCCGCSVCPVS